MTVRSVRLWNKRKRRALVEQLRATVSADVAAIQAAQAQLSYTRIVSPVYR